MTKGRIVLLGAPTIVLAALLAASYLTRDPTTKVTSPQEQDAGAPKSELVDQGPWRTASELAPLADSAEEQALAREAERLADHEVDRAFSMALRQAAMVAPKPSAQTQELESKVKNWAERVKDDQAQVDLLEAQVAHATRRGGAAANSVTADLTNAQMLLQDETDEMNDASNDLAQASGDMRPLIQQEYDAHQAATEKYDAEVSTGHVADTPAKQYSGLAQLIEEWLGERDRTCLLLKAEAQTGKEVGRLTTLHASTEKEVSDASAEVKGPFAEGAKPASARPAGATPVASSTPKKGKSARMATVHGLAQIHSLLDERLDTERQLSLVYAKWSAQLSRQHRGVAHRVWQSMSGMASVVAGAVLVWWLVQTLLQRSKIDPRSQHTLRIALTLGIELVTVILVLVVIFGVPNEVPTILGLATAGLTVVFRDFILAFFGWFVLMGKNGVRVGDWVEINGVGGEVVEMGLFRTTLLETGNWTDRGHPTGRRVMFINNYAVTGQFFNFSTAGQWMWDEISLNVPAGVDKYKTIEAIHAAVLKETADESKLAEAEWQGVTKRRGVGQFSATPSVGVRPAANGVDLLVRYVTRAGDRFETRNRLFQTMIELLHKPQPA